MLAANARDVAAGQANGLDAALLDRLALDDARFDGMLEGLRQVIALPDPVGEMSDFSYRPSGIQLGKMRVPLGVIGIIYESRPNVTLEAAALCLKSGNATILRGGSEALHSNQAIAAGPDKAAPVLAQAATTLREWGAKKGVDVEPEVMKITTGAHLTIINTLMQQDPKKAEAYFATHKKEIDGTRWDEIGARINQVSAITDGETKANEVWAKYVKPGDYKNPVDQFALEKEMRAAFPNDPTRQKAGIQALREMSAAWNKSQTEAIAAGTNQVYKMLDSGTPMSKVMKSDAWASLSGDQQHRIRLQLEQVAAARASRAASKNAGYRKASLGSA